MAGPAEHERRSIGESGAVESTAREAARSPIERSLVRLRRVARTLLALDAISIVVLGLLAASVSAALFDYLFLAPVGLRWAAWGAGVVAGGLAMRRLLVPAVRFRPGLAALALRVEGSPEGERAGLRGVLASGLEFARGQTPRDPMEAALSARVTREAMERFSASLVLPVLRPRRPVARLAALALSVGAAIGAWVLWPGTVGTGAARVLAPWMDISWPTRTALSDATEGGAHDIGRPLALEADLTRTDRGPGQTRVWASYRLRVREFVGPTRRVAMMWQPGMSDEARAASDGSSREAPDSPRGEESAERSGTESGAQGDGRGERYAWYHADLAGEAEELAKSARDEQGGGAPGAGAQAAAEEHLRPVEFEVEYWFQTADAQTKAARVLIVEPPMVVGARLSVTPPAYVPEGLRGELGYLSGEHDLGPGTDERAKAGPILEGSRVSLAVEFNKALGEQYADAEGVLAGFGLPLAEQAEASATIEGSVYTISAVVSSMRRDPMESVSGPEPGETVDDPAGTVPPQGNQIEVEPAAGPATIEIPIRVTDRHGLRSERESMFRLALAIDQNPTAVVTEPAADESLLSTAVIELAGEGADDVGIARVALERQRAASPASSEGATPEPTGSAELIAEAAGVQGAGRQRVVRALLDLSTLGLRVGDELWITTVAQDNYAAGRTSGPQVGGLAGQALGHEPARSAPRRLRIISQTELIDQIREDLGGVREAAIRLDDAQSRLLASVAASGATTESARGQAGVTSSIDDQARYLERLAQRMERNRLGDAALAALVEDVAQSLQSAGESSGQATSSLDESLHDQESRPEPATPEAREEQARQDALRRERTQREQRRVRDELQRLAAMLDRGSDGWQVRRELERLLDAQRGLMQETASAGAQTAGRESQQLSPDERTELERIAQRQFELAQQAAATIDELSQRARDLQDADPAQSSGMRSAAQTGRERQVSENLNQASQQIQRNNTNTAQQQQQEAVDAMQEMLDNLEEGQRGRDQTLQRVLATLVESLDALIQGQEFELGRLGEARALARLDTPGSGHVPADGPLDRAMIALNTNTMGVIDLISTGYPELGSVQRMVGDASSAQADAIVGLRAIPIGYDTAQEGETTSLTRLREARAEAKRMEEQAAQRENARKRRELRQAYRALLEQEVALRGDVEPYVGVELGRRQRSEVRALGEAQETLRVAIGALRDETAEMGEASVFLLAHRRLDSLLTRAAGPLREGRADSAIVGRMRSAVEILQSLVESLDDSQPEQSPFEEGGGAGGGGGGGGGGQEQPVIMPVYELRLLRGMQEQALGLTRDLDSQGAGADPDDVADLGALQRMLAEEATGLIQRMQAPPPEGTSPAGSGAGGPQ